MSSHNNPYDDDGVGLIGGLLRTGIAGASIYGGVKFIRDEEGFKSGLTKAYNKIRPIKDKAPVSPVHEEQLNLLKQATKEGLEISKKLTSSLAASRAADLSNHGAKGMSIAFSESEMPKEIVKMARQFNFSSLDHIKSSSGASIGADVVQAIKDLGLNIDGKPHFNGTNLVVNVAGGSGYAPKKISIPFAAYDKSRESWLTKTGHRINTAPQARLLPVERAEGKVGAILLDENTYILNALSDVGNLIQTARGDEEFEKILQSKFASANGKGGTAFRDIDAYVKHLIGKSEAGKIAGELNLVKTLRSAVKAISMGHKQVNGLAEEAIAIHGSEVLLDRVAQGKINELYPGYGVSEMTSRPFSVNAATPQVFEDNMRGYLSFPERVRQDPSLVTSGRMLRDEAGRWHMREGEIGTKAINKSFYKNFISNLNFTSGQSQTAAGTLTVRNPTTVVQTMTEGFKSEKGYMLSEGLWNREVKDVLPQYWERLRHAPMFVNKKTAAQQIGSMIKRKNNFNALFAISAFDEDMISLSGDLAKDAKAHLPFGVKLDQLLEGESLREKSMANIEDFINGKWVSRKDQISFNQIYTDEALRNEILTSTNVRARVRKGNILGLKDVASPINETDEAIDLIERDNRFVKTRADWIIGQDEMRATLASNTYRDIELGRFAQEGTSPGFQIYGRLESSPFKWGLTGSQTRSAAHIGINKNVKTLQRLAGVSTDIEGTISHDIFGKHWPLMRGAEIVAQKNTPDYLTFLMGSLQGTVQAYKEQPVLLSGDAAKRFSKYIHGGGVFNSRGHLDLTATAMQGKLQWQQMLTDESALGRQISDVASVLGQVREHVTSVSGKYAGIGISNIDQSFGERIGEQWSIATSSAGNISDLSSLEARKHLWHYQAGLQAQEIAEISQGKNAFNEMRIGIKDFQYYMNKPEIFKELISQSTVNTGERLTQASIMHMNMKGENFAEALQAYGAEVNHKFDVLDAEQIQDMLGGVDGIGPHGLDNMKSVEAMHDTFLSSVKNKHGFAVKSAKGNVYIPGAELLGEGTYVPSTGKVTYSEYATNVFKMLQGAAQNNGVVSEEALEKYQGFTAEYLASTKSGALRMSAARVRGSIYAKHVSDVNFLNSNELEGLLARKEGAMASELQNMLGQSVSMSSREYKKTIQQQVTNAFELHKNNPEEYRNVRQALNTMFGENNQLASQYSAIEEAIAGAEGPDGYRKALGEWASDFTDMQTRKSDRLRKEIWKYARGSSSHDERLTRIMANMETDLGSAMFVRYPSIYGSSNSAGLVFLDKQIRERTVALGKIARINLNADTDGDSIMLRQLFSKGSRKETLKMINTHQRYTAEVLKNMKGRHVAGALASGEARIAPLAGGLTADLARSMVREAPIATASAAVFTKALTGAFSIKALGQKGYMQTLLRGSGVANEDNFMKVQAFFSTVPSRITEQEVISSKHLEMILGGAGKMDSITSLLDVLTPEKVRGAVGAMGGELHPLVLSAAIAGQGFSNQKFGSLYDQVANRLDMLTHTRTLEKHEFMSAEMLVTSDQNALNSRWAAYQKGMAEQVGSGNHPYFERSEFEEAGFKGKRLLDLMRDSAKEGAKGGNASESIETMMRKAIKLSQSDESIRMQQLFKSMHSQNFNLKTAQMMFTNKKIWEEAEKRTFIGMKKLERAFEWMTESGKMGTRLGALGAAGFVAMTALNLLSGDGTPEDPNDVPSVNNPAFHGHSGNFAGYRTIGNKPNFNGSVGLLTDSNLSFDSAQGQLSNLINSRGYNSVSIRHDGTDPYKADMHKYSH